MAVGYDYGRFEPAMQKVIMDAIDDGIAKAKAELAAEYASRSGLSEREVRMAALDLAKHMVSADEMISYADHLAQYVLTGKKPGAEG